MSDELRLRPLRGLPEIGSGDDVAALLAAKLPADAGPGVLAVAQKIVSKAEGRTVSLADVVPSARATGIATAIDKDPRMIEVVLGETRRIVRQAPGVVICETHHGLVCANAGVDRSNAPGDEIAILLPVDPDASAERIRKALGPGRGVVITDTFGRPWREGLVDVAIGVAGFEPLRDQKGETDREGRELQITVMALADQLAAAAGVLMEKSAGVPAVWIDGIEVSGSGRLADLVRDPEKDLFR